ncbi:MAG: hypothetical protein M3Y35_04720 [Actinomycetota bacterium]|nr:hypothetical protein [Actinomycetota bacterium]
MSSHNRVTAGVPRGGQFAPGTQAESATALEVSEGWTLGDPSPRSSDEAKAARAKGFPHGDESDQRWMAEGFDGRDAHEWRAYGFDSSPGDAAGWRDHDFDAVAARAFTEAGLHTPQEAAPYRDAGLDPITDREWLSMRMPVDRIAPFRDAGFEPTLAREWNLQGFDADAALEWSGLGRPYNQPLGARLGNKQGWTPDTLRERDARFATEAKAKQEAAAAVKLPKATSQAIKVRTAKTGDREVQADVVNGHFASHQSVFAPGRWSVTHVGTGRGMASADSKMAARAIAAQLARIDPDLGAVTTQAQAKSIGAETIRAGHMDVRRRDIPALVVMVKEGRGSQHHVDAVQDLLINPASGPDSRRDQYGIPLPATGTKG